MCHMQPVGEYCDQPDGVRCAGSDRVSVTFECSVPLERRVSCGSYQRCHIPLSRVNDHLNSIPPPLSPSLPNKVTQMSEVFPRCTQM